MEREVAILESADFDHAEVIYDPPSDGDGADNDFDYATRRVADADRESSRRRTREGGRPRGARSLCGGCY